MKKNSFLTFLCACMPGFGQMYLAYMKRGVSLSLGFWGTIILASFFRLDFLLLLLPVIWAFSFFDTFNIHSLTPEQLSAFPDKYLLSKHSIQKFTSFVSNLISGSHRKLLAFIFVFVGIYTVLYSIVTPFLAFYGYYDNIFYYLLRSSPTLFVALIVIFLGIKMLKNPKKESSFEKNDSLSLFETESEI